MALSKAAGAPPIFFGVPYPQKASDTAAQIIATSMQALVHRIYQMDPSAYWQGSLGADDTQTEIITMGIYSGVSQYTVTLDSFILLNINLKNFLIEYCTDYTPGTGGAAGTGTWQTVTGGNITGNTATDYALFLVTPIALNGLRLTMTTTITANQNKSIGNFIACLSKFQVSNPPTKFQSPPRQARVDVEMADKSIDATWFGWSDNSFTFFGIEFEFDYLTTTDIANIDSVFLAAASFLVYPEPGDSTRKLYLCLTDPPSYNPNYNSSWKGAGLNVPIRFKQVGYL